MTRTLRLGLVLCLAALCMAGTQGASSMSLSSVQFPERDTVKIEFLPTDRMPDAEVSAKVTYRDGQSRIELKFNDMKPAVLFGGNVTTYVVWAVSRTGVAENLGELVVHRDDDEEMLYSTRLKDFALVITAEPFYLVSDPSELVAFINGPAREKDVTSEPFRFSGFVAAADHDLESIAAVSWDSDESIELLQAQKAHELAKARRAGMEAPVLFQRASESLEKAMQLDRKGKHGRKFQEQVRRSVSYSNQALRVAERSQLEQALEDSIAQRRAELEALEENAAAARARAGEAETRVRKAREEKARLEASLARLTQRQERLESTLQDALSTIADTREDARGLIVSLPNVLFEVDEARLRPEARVILAKLAGALLLLPDVRIDVEGHTDSTGSSEYNQRLSRDRALSVARFLEEHGVSAGQIHAKGLGETDPVADNSTKEGRRRNRRVEIVINRLG